MVTGKTVLVGVAVALAAGAVIVGARTWTTGSKPVEIEPEPQPIVEAEHTQERTFAQRERRPDPVNQFQREPREEGIDDIGARRNKDWRQQRKSRFDVDGDGQISDEEKQAAIDAKRKNGEQMKAQWISRYDKDGDGELSKEEIGEAKAEHYRARQEFEAVLVDRFDTDGDGELSDIEREAAHTAIRTEAMEFFNSFDADGDGQLSDGERQTAKDELKRRGAQRKAVETIDVDRDGAILSAEASDAIVRVHLGDPTADYNADGIVDERDAQVVMDYFTGAASDEQSLLEAKIFGSKRSGP